MIDSNTISNLILVSALILFITAVILLARVEKLYKDLEYKIRATPKELKKRATRLRDIEEGLKKRKYELRGKEEQQVLDEMGKIGDLWKSRRERLRGGFWEKIEESSNELKKPQDDKERIEELIKNTKAKYHKREIDEESFREIVKDYQKELMEINLKIEGMKKKQHL